MATPINDAHLTVHLTPRGGRDAIEGWRDGELRVRVAAPAVDSRANEALLRLLARSLGVSPGRVRMVRGERSRAKLVAVDGLTQEEANRRLGA